MRPRDPDVGRSESGFTLPEVIIALSLTVLLSITAFATVGSFLSSTNTSQQRLTNTGQAQLVFDRFTKEIRAATANGAPVVAGSPSAAVQFADPYHMTFYSSLAAPDAVPPVGPQKIDLALNVTTGVLTETVTPAVASTTATNGWVWPGPSTTILTPKVDGSHGSLFYYYTAGADPTLSGTDIDVTPAITPATTPNSSDIDIITIDLWVRQTTGTSPALSTEVKSVIHLRNVDYTQ